MTSTASKLSGGFSGVQRFLFFAATTIMSGAEACNFSTVTNIQVAGVEFPAFITPRPSKIPLFLAGAGVRGIEIEGNFVKFTAIGVYLEYTAVSALSHKWKGKTAHELKQSVRFYRDLVTGPSELKQSYSEIPQKIDLIQYSGPFEKLTRVTMILPLTGAEYSKKVVENCVADWKSRGVYTDAEAKATQKFMTVFKDRDLPPGASVLFTQFPHGSLAISFSKDGTVPECETAVIENKPLSEAVLWSIIGDRGVSPAAKQSLAERLSVLLSG